MTKNNLETDNILSLLIKLSVPAIIGMSVQAIYNLVDRIFIGQSPDLGPLGLAAAVVVYPIMMFTVALSLLITNGGATLFSIALGAKRKDNAIKYQANSFTLSLTLGICITTIVFLFMNPILDFLGGEGKVGQLAKEYMQIIVFGSIFSTISMFGAQFSRAQGNPLNAMISMLLGALFNILFDYILIIKLHMGMRGAALATIGGQLLSAIWQLAFLFSKRSIIPLKIKELKLKFDAIKPILITGIPVFLVNASASLVIGILNKITLAYGGDIGLSVIAILGSIQMMTQMPIIGFIQGQVPIISYNYGANRLDRIKKALRYSILASTIVMIIAAIVIQFNTSLIIKLFNNSPELLKLAAPFIRIALLALPLIGAQAMLASLFQATGHVQQASLLNLSRQVIILIPLLLILPQFIGLKGVFIAMPIADISSFILAIILATKLLKKLKGEER